MPIRIVSVSEKRKAKRGQFKNTQRENRLEELGRVDAEKAYTSKGKRNLRDEKHRIRKELKSGGRSSGWPKGGPSKPRPKPLPSPGRPRKKWEVEFPKWGRPSRKLPEDMRDRLKDLTKKGTPSPGSGGRGKRAPDKRWNKGDKFMIPLRAKKAVGGIAKKVGKRFLDFIKTGKHVDKHGVKTNIPKAAERLTGKPHVDHGKRKRIKHLGKGKAKGGRIGLQHGSRPRPQGPHVPHPHRPRGVKIAKRW